MIIDTHVYVWDEASDPRRLPSASQSWVPAELLARRGAVTLDAVNDEMTAAGVAGVVLIQSTNSLHHTVGLLDAAASSPRPTKVVGWLPLADPAETASALRRFADQPALAGARHRIRDGDDPGLLRTALAAESLELLADAGLTLTVMPWPPAVLSQVPAIATEHPDLSIVVDLLGWPAIGERRMQPWTDHLAAAAACPTVSLKVGGLFRMTGAGADASEWQPYVATAVDLFGPERIMIGSDWPALLALGLTYGDTISKTLQAFADLTPRERAFVEYGTAARVYGFDSFGGTSIPR